MASVRLRFSPPPIEDLTKLMIYEAASADGPWGAPLETIEPPEIGVYPDYIDHYTTNLATSNVNWFTVVWEDSKGAQTERSNPVQGGTDNLVGEIMDLVEERDINLDTQVVRQEAEFAIETYYGKDPYTVEETRYSKKVGLARLVQARTMINNLAKGASTGSGWTAGLVSMKSSTGGADEKLIRWLIDAAAAALGLNYARVAQMATMVIAGGQSAYEIGTAEPVLIEVE